MKRQGVVCLNVGRDHLGLHDIRELYYCILINVARITTGGQPATSKLTRAPWNQALATLLDMVFNL